MNVNRAHLTILAVWFLSVLVSYIFFIPPTTRLSTMLPSGMATIYTEALDRAPLVDSIALVAMSKMAEDPMVDFALASIRKVGNWKGDIYLLTDRSTCFVDAAKTYDVKLVPMEPISSLMKIKALKPTLLHYLPESVQGVLYVDVDIVVTRDLSEFFTDLKDAATRQLWRSVNTDSASSSSSTAIAVPPTQEEGTNTTVADNTAVTAPKLQSLFDFGAFLDAKGHYVGFCSGCDKWHTGVVWLQRPNLPIAATTAEVGVSRRRFLSSKSENNRRTRKHDNTTSVVPSSTSSTDIDITTTSVPSAIPTTVRSALVKADTAPNQCMRAWAATLISGQFTTDQESLDEIERSGACPTSRALVLPARHLLFAKDYIGMTLTSGQTFLHLTAAGRLDTQDFFYRDMVVPRLRNALRPALNPYAILKNKKTCS